MRREYGAAAMGTRGRRRARRRGRFVCGLMMTAVIVGAGIILGARLGKEPAPRGGTEPKTPLAVQTQLPGTPEPALSVPEPPDWVRQELLPVNEYSRPGTPLEQVNGVVVHYVGNPGTTAKQNRSYFASLAQTHETWASSHFLIDTDGTVIQCVPLDEISYCSTVRNKDTIAIECCHPDAEGKFTPETMDSLVRLLNWLIEAYRLKREDVIRHYDVAGKECPVYYVKNPEAWEGLLDLLTFPG